MSADGRPVPDFDDDSSDFWHGGAAGQLVVKACTSCNRMFHPPAAVCPHCFGRSIVSRPVSGRGRLVSYTVVRRPWVPGYDPPYLVARVVLDEQADLHLLTNLVDCEPGSVAIGMPVAVQFEQRDDVFVPVFGPVP